MVKTTGQILKSEDFELEGQFHLDLARAGLDLPRRTAAASSEPQVRILENHPEYAIIEVICSCGARISVRCEYANTPA